MIIHHDVVALVCLDDKASIPVGAPRTPIPTGVRGNHRSLVVEGLPYVLAASDCDWHVAHITVYLLVSVAEAIDQSVFDGRIYVTYKGRVFQPSSAF